MSRAIESYDACVVGSGAGGGAAALALCRAGLRVLVLEKGRDYREEDFFHDELLTCRRDFFVPSPQDEPRTVVGSDGTASRGAAAWIACCVGGGTVHMSGYFFRMHREDLRLRSRFGEVSGAAIADWPIEWEELEPHYDEAERLLGLSGDAAKSPPEPRRLPHPLPPLASHPAALLVESAAAARGLRAFQTPRAITSVPYQGRAGCAYCGFCGSYGCEVGAKASSPVALLRPALATARLTVRPRAMVTRVQYRGGRATGVLFLDDKGALHEVRARAVVLAASAIETARLLLASGGPEAPHGLGNDEGLVGRNLLFATFAAGSGRFPRDSPHFPPGLERALPFLDRAVQDHYLVEGAGLPFPKAGTILFQLPHVNPIFQAVRQAHAVEPGAPPLWGEALSRRLRDWFHEGHSLEWEAFSEFLPHAGAQVSLDPDVKDRFGLPVARLRMGVHPASLAASDHLAGVARDVMRFAGATALRDHHDERVYPVLQGGTARMGRDRATSVCGPDGALHAARNVFIADASTFPSSSGAPFTLTIIANALRVGAAIAARARRGEL